MLILSSRGVVFIHLHRCGGSTVERSLAVLLAWNDILLGSTRWGEALQPIYQELFGLHKHSSALEVKAVIGEARWTEAFTFTTVRCPFERTASVFNFAAALVEPRLAATGFPQRADWREQRQWVEQWTDPPEHFWHWALIRAYLLARGAPQPFSTFLREPALVEKEVAFQPQVTRLLDPDGRVLVTEIIKLEALDRQWPRLCQRIGTDELALVKANATPAPYRRTLRELTRDPEDLRYLERRFEDDFAVLGYPRRS
jgi:hypothetical protein